MNIKIIDEIKARLPLTGGTMTGNLYDKNSSMAFLPVGAVFAFAANSEPAGCLLCNGAAVSRTTYADLFAAIGTTYGEGDGSTTFNLPDLTDKFIQGSATAGTVKSAGLPEIYGGFDSTGDSSVIFGNAWGAFSLGEPSGSRRVGSTWASDVVHNVTFNASKDNPIYSASTTVQPPAVTMRYYIKY